jgi:hypothetical protein
MLQNGYLKMSDIKRKLAKIVRLHSVYKHPNADLLDICRWDGWQCVAKRGEFKENDLIMGKILVKDIWEKDSKKKKIAEINGYTVLYIWEHDIVKKSDCELIKFVSNILLENNYVCG